jgi:hypothetical protein
MVDNNVDERTLNREMDVFIERIATSNLNPKTLFPLLPNSKFWKKFQIRASNNAAILQTATLDKFGDGALGPKAQDSKQAGHILVQNDNKVYVKTHEGGASKSFEGSL